MLDSTLLRPAIFVIVLVGLAVSTPRAQEAPPPTTQRVMDTAGLEPGDVIRLRIWREPDMSGEFPIQQDGSAVLPRLGPWPAAGKSPQALQDELVEAYGEYLRNPSIEVFVLRRVNIVGEVRSPGLYTVDPTMTVTDALAMAGGPTPNADKGKIIVIREGQEMEIELDEKFSVVDLSLQSGDQIYVPERSWFMRNIGIVTSLVTLTVTLVGLAVR